MLVRDRLKEDSQVRSTTFEQYEPKSSQCGLDNLVNSHQIFFNCKRNEKCFTVYLTIQTLYCILSVFLLNVHQLQIVYLSG